MILINFMDQQESQIGTMMYLCHDKAWAPYTDCIAAVSDGQLNLDFVGQIDNAIINGIEVLRIN